MSLDYVKFSNGFEKFMPKEYRDMVEHGPFGKKMSVSQMGSFKEVLEEHPMCAGCAMTLFIRLAMIAFPNPEDTITVGTAGCGRLAISQAAIPFVYGNYGDQNGVASGLSRGLRLRFGDRGTFAHLRAMRRCRAFLLPLGACGRLVVGAHGLRLRAQGQHLADDHHNCQS